MVYLPDHPAVWVLVFFTGAVIGSFLNVVIYRWPRGESIIRPPSHCMSCGERLGVVDLIPVVSYVLLRGRCRHCGRRFSPRYAVVEAITGGLLLGALSTWALSWYAVAVFIMCCSLLLVFFIDLDHMIIPDELVILLALVGVGLNVYDLLHFGIGDPAQGTHAVVFAQQLAGEVRSIALPSSLVGIACGGGAFMLMSWAFQGVFGKPVLGFGDVKLAAALGAVFGPGWMFVAWFLVSVVLGAAVAVTLMALGVRKRGEYIPFGPMLATGAVVLLLFPEVGAQAISLYGG